jgi:tricorn protease-like protein
VVVPSLGRVYADVLTPGNACRCDDDVNGPLHPDLRLGGLGPYPQHPGGSPYVGAGRGCADLHRAPNSPQATITVDVWACKLSPDGKIAAVTTHQGGVNLWNTESGELIRDLEGTGNFGMSIDYSSDGTTIAMGDERGRVRVWDVETGRIVQTFEDHHAPVRSVSFTPNGRTLASASDDKRILLLDP